MAPFERRFCELLAIEDAAAEEFEIETAAGPRSKRPMSFGRESMRLPVIGCSTPCYASDAIRSSRAAVANVG